MSKINNYLLSSACLVLGLLSQVVGAQTIEEMANIAKLRQQATAPGVVMPPVPNMEVAPGKMDAPPPAAIKTAQPEMVVTSIYTSQGASQAGISIGGSEVFVGVGDVISNGWKIDSIAVDTVLLKRCSSAKRCESKKLNYTFTR